MPSRHPAPHPLMYGTPGQQLRALMLWEASRPFGYRSRPLPAPRELTGRSRWEQRFCWSVQTLLVEALRHGELRDRKGFRSAAELPLPLAWCWTIVGTLPAAERHPLLLRALPFFRPVPPDVVPCDPAANLCWGAAQWPSLFPSLPSR